MSDRRLRYTGQQYPGEPRLLGLAVEDGVIRNYMALYCDHLPAFAQHDPWIEIVPTYASNASAAVRKEANDAQNELIFLAGWGEPDAILEPLRVAAGRLNHASVPCDVCGHTERFSPLVLWRIVRVARDPESSPDTLSKLWQLGVREMTTSTGLILYKIPLLRLQGVRRVAGAV